MAGACGEGPWLANRERLRLIAAGGKAAALAIAILFMLAGSEGLPFVEDIEDLLDGALQRLGYNFSSKHNIGSTFNSIGQRFATTI